MRRDLEPKYQLAQTLHAGLQFALEYREKFDQWDLESKSVICLSVADENELRDLHNKLTTDLGYKVSMFCEPDIGNEATCLAVYADYGLRKKLSSLPLALREVAA